MSMRRAMKRRRFSTFPMPIHECTSHVGVLVHGNRTPDVHEAGPACRCHAFGCATTAEAAMPIRPSRPWLGVTPLFGMARSASGRIAMYTAILPSAAGSLPASSPVREGPTARRSGASGSWTAMPHSPSANRSAGRSSAASKRRSLTLPGRIAAPLATPRGRGRRVRKHTRPRTRTRPSDWGVATVTAQVARVPRATRAARAKDVAAAADKREERCASADGQSAHRPPLSFARSGTALSPGVAYRPTRLRRTEPLARRCRPARTTADKPKRLHDWPGQSAAMIPRLAITSAVATGAVCVRERLPGLREMRLRRPGQVPRPHRSLGGSPFHP